MDMVKIATLKAHLSRYLDQVREGNEVVVYDRDTPIARIVPYAPRAGRTTTPHEAADEERLADLERRGVIARRGNARATARWLKTFTPIALPKGTPSLSQVLREMRDEEPW